MHVTKNTTVNAAPTRISSVSDYSNYRLISNRGESRDWFAPYFHSQFYDNDWSLTSREEKFIFRKKKKKKQNI